MDYKNLTEEHLEEHIDKLISIADSIEVGKITILTGSNASGKSLIRKLLPFSINRRLGLNEKERSVSSISMQLRTELKSEWGAFSSITHDMPEDSTSQSTIYTLTRLLNNFKDDESNKKEITKKFLVIDELEIGMSNEVILGTCLYLNDLLKKIEKNIYGVLIITHSELVVRSLEHSNFINIDGLSEEEWIHRPLVPVMPEDLTEWAISLYRAIQNRSDRNKQKKAEREDK